MTVADNFKMTRDEVRAVTVRAANTGDDPRRSPVFQLRTLLGI